MKKLTFWLGCLIVSLLIIQPTWAAKAPSEAQKATVEAKKAQDLTMTNRELRILLLSRPLQTLRNARDISPAFKFKLLLTMQKLNAILETVEKVRQEIMDAYAERDKKGKKIIVDRQFQFGDKADEVTAKIDKLLDEKVTIPGGRITVNLSKDLPDGLLSVQELLFLSVLIDFEE